MFLPGESDFSKFAGMNISLYLARRISLSPRGHSTSPALRLAVSAVALSISVMLCAVAVVLGFKHEIRQKVFGFNSHLTILGSAPDGDVSPVLLSSSLEKIISEEPYVKSWSLEVSVPAILKTPSDFKGIYLRGIGSDKGTVQRDFIEAALTEGRMPDYGTDGSRLQILISASASRQLGLHAGDRVDACFLNDGLRVRRMEVAGVFDTHFDTYDDVLAYGDLGTLQSLAGIGNRQGSAIQIATDDYERIPEYAARMQKRLVDAVAEGELYAPLQVDNAMDQGAGFFNWLSLLDMNVVVVLALMALVAVATLVSGLFILVMDKREFITTVRMLGMATGEVRRVFVWLTMRIAVTGAAVGNIMAFLLLFIQNRWHMIRLDPEAYYIDFVPVVFNWWIWALLNAVTLAVIYLCLLLPPQKKSWRTIEV